MTFVVVRETGSRSHKVTQCDKQYSSMFTDITYHKYQGTGTGTATGFIHLPYMLSHTYKYKRGKYLFSTLLFFFTLILVVSTAAALAVFNALDLEGNLCKLIGFPYLYATYTVCIVWYQIVPHMTTDGVSVFPRAFTLRYAVPVPGTGTLQYL